MTQNVFTPSRFIYFSLLIPSHIATISTLECHFVICLVFIPPYKIFRAFSADISFNVKLKQKKQTLSLCTDFDAPYLYRIAEAKKLSLMLSVL